MMEITDVSQRIMFPWRLFCPVDGGMVLSVCIISHNNISRKNSNLWMSEKLECFIYNENIILLSNWVSFNFIYLRALGSVRVFILKLLCMP